MEVGKRVWQKTQQELQEELGSGPEGLTSAQVSERQKRYGPNELRTGGRKSVLRIFLEQFADFLVVVLLLRSKGAVRLEVKSLKIHWDILKKVLRVGIPAALQMAVTAFSNVFVQSYITYFDRGLPSSYYMSGWTSYIKVDQLLFLPVQSISLATTTFVGQNLGKNLPKRAKEGVRSALLLSIAVTVVIMIPVLIFAPSIVGFLNPDPEVIKTGSMFLRLLTPFFIVHGFNQIYASALRGAGNSKVPMIMMLTSFVLFRQLYLFVMSKICNEIVPIALAYPSGWLLCALLTGIYYHTTKLEKSRLVE